MLSPLAARKAEKLGYRNVKVFHGGLPAWKKAGNVIVSNVAGLERYNKLGASYILLDLRPKSAVKKGHMPKAVVLPEGGVSAMKGQFPKYKNAAIVLYNQDGNLASATPAFEEIRGWGYKNLSILSGGIEAWKTAGKKIVKGPAASQITYVRKLLPGEFEVEAFKVLVSKPSKDTLLLDVRGEKELAEGVLPNTKNVPLEDLEQRLSSLPKDKTIVIHCSTGARAEMAYNILKKAGFKAKYVKAKVDFDKDKKDHYSITE